jgi:DNA-binding NtrC family response regulator
MENLIIQGILFADGSEIQPADVGLGGPQEAVAGISTGMDEDLLRLTYKEAKAKVLEAFNARYIGRRLTDTGGNVTQAARDCGLERQALQQIMRRYNISAENYRQ